MKAIAQVLMNSTEFRWVLENLAQGYLEHDEHAIVDAITHVVNNSPELRRHMRQVIKNTQDELKADNQGDNS